MSIAVTKLHNSIVVKQSKSRNQHATNITGLCFKNIQVNYELKIMKSSQIIYFLAELYPRLLVTENKIIFIYMRDRQAPEIMKSLSLVLEDENWSIVACLAKCICCLLNNVRMRFTSKDTKSTQLLPNTHFCHLDFRCFCFPVSYKVLSWFC